MEIKTLLYFDPFRSYSSKPNYLSQPQAFRTSNEPNIKAREHNQRR